ncbi:MAG: Cytochrome c [Pedosphaera sp.]|nr:Cytochrome c [Pedosphaera sp.]
MNLTVRKSSLCCALLLALCGCRREMYDQPRYNPLAPSSFFPDGAGSRPLVPGTVARGHLDADQAFYEGKTGTNLVVEFPMPVTLEVLERGRERYDIYCSVCHGRLGDGNGMIPQRGYPHPPTFHDDRLRQAPVGHYFDVITHGYGVMYSYASRVEPADRWAVTTYIRALQLSQYSKLDQLPPAERAKLESARK